MSVPETGARPPPAAPVPLAARLWRLLVPGGLVVMFAAALLGVFRDDGIPAILFGIGIAATAAGVVSFGVHLFRSARRAVETWGDDRDDAGADSRGKGP